MKYSQRNQNSTIVKEDYSKTIILSSEQFNNDGHLLQTVVIPPKTKQRKHYHQKQTEVFYILKGECEIYINDKLFLAKPGDAFITEPGDTHWLWNKSDQEFELVVFKINKPSDSDDTNWEVENE